MLIIKQLKKVANYLKIIIIKTMSELISKAANIIAKSKYTVAFTGAGISVESGIPPFRGKGGLWEEYDPIILDLSYFKMNTLESWKAIKKLFYDFFGKAKPNEAHRVLAKLEEQGILKSIITQNIDNLHQESGSKTVYEFHGTAETMVCMGCGAKYLSPNVNLGVLPPQCDKCKSVLKPDFVFFGEGIPQVANEMSLAEMNKCDVLIIVGTTGEVMPASMLPNIAKQNGSTIIEINLHPSNFTNGTTDIFLQGKAGTILPKLYSLINV